jgi:hypothetical protein
MIKHGQSVIASISPHGVGFIMEEHFVAYPGNADVLVGTDYSYLYRCQDSDFDFDLLRKVFVEIQIQIQIQIVLNYLSSANRRQQRSRPAMTMIYANNIMVYNTCVRFACLEHPDP